MKLRRWFSLLKVSLPLASNRDARRFFFKNRYIKLDFFQLSPTCSARPLQIERLRIRSARSNGASYVYQKRPRPHYTRGYLYLTITAVISSQTFCKPVGDKNSRFFFCQLTYLTRYSLRTDKFRGSKLNQRDKTGEPLTFDSATPDKNKRFILY